MNDMKKLIWKFRYALRIRQRAKVNWAFCWECACIGLNEWLDDWQEWNPADAADEELSYWTD